MRFVSVLEMKHARWDVLKENVAIVLREHAERTGEQPDVIAVSCARFAAIDECEARAARFRRLAEWHGVRAAVALTLFQTAPDRERFARRAAEHAEQAAHFALEAFRLGARP